MIGQPVKGQTFVNQAIVSRVNSWLLVAIVVAVLLLATALLVATQPGLIHAMGSVLHNSQPMAGQCPGGAPTC
jgi:hypothetical protein